MNTPEIFDTPMSARQFNRMQWDLYGDNVVRCIMNNISYELKERYYPRLHVNYGYALKNRFFGIRWKKRKCDFGFLSNHILDR